MKLHHNILHIFASNAWGGGEQYVFDLAKSQLNDGHKITFISGKSDIIRQKIIALNCCYFTLWRRWHFNPFSILRTRKIILQEQINIIHAHQFGDAFIATFAALLVKKDKRPKVIMTRHLVRHGKSGMPYQWLYHHLEKIIFVSETAKQFFLKGVQVPAEKITVIHNGVFPHILQTHINYREKLNLSTDCLLIGFVGTVANYKGVELLLNVASKLQNRNIVFLLAGAGETKYLNFLLQQIAEKQMNERFFLLGFINDTADFISQMDICIFPSLCTEAFGLVLIECMQQGVALIASNTGAQSEIIDDKKNGFLITPTEEEIYKTLNVLCENKTLRQKIGNYAKISVDEKFAYPIFYEKMMTVYNEISA